MLTKILDFSGSLSSSSNFKNESAVSKGFSGKIFSLETSTRSTNFFTSLLVNITSSGNRAIKFDRFCMFFSKCCCLDKISLISYRALSRQLIYIYIYIFVKIII